MAKLWQWDPGTSIAEPMDNLLKWNYHVKIKDDDLAIYVFVNVYLVHIKS